MSDSELPDAMSPDDRLWALLDRFLAGECTADEAGEVRSWLAADPARRELLESARRAREIAAARPPVRSVEAAWRRAAGELGLNGSAAKPARLPRPSAKPALEVRLPASRQRGVMTAAFRAAAAVVLVAGGAVLWRTTHRPPPAAPAPITFATYTTQPGQRLSLRLADGSLVVLAPGSTLRKPSDYGTTTRTLHLDGEAYFDVVHDSTRPMAVHTAQTVARDLGTRFVVRAYPGDSATDVIVAEGEVAVDTAVLERGDRAHVPADGHLRVTTGVALDRYFAWVEGRLVFRDTPLRDVAVRLARWYDVEVRFGDAAVGDRRLTASFADVPVTEVFDRIAGPLGLEVTRNDRVYTLHRR